MKINNNDLTNLAAADSARTSETQQAGSLKGASGGAGASSSGDRVEFSSTLQQLAQAVSAYGQSRASRVQELAAQYQSGSYRADSFATSRAMVSEALAGAQ